MGMLPGAVKGFPDVMDHDKPVALAIGFHCQVKYHLPDVGVKRLWEVLQWYGADFRINCAVAVGGVRANVDGSRARESTESEKAHAR